MKGVVGIALTLVLLASLTVGLAGAPAGADPGTLKFTTLALPQVGPDGGYWAYPDANVGPIAVSPDGGILFAAVEDTAYDVWALMRSNNGGYSWRDLTGFTDPHKIVDVVVSPDYADDPTVFVATENFVYQSVDGGSHFFQMNQGWATETITDLDVALDGRGRLAIMVGTESDVYVLSTATGMTWQAQEIGTTYDVLTCAFSPFFADDEGIVAVVTDGTETLVRFAFFYTAGGGGWGADIGDASIKAANGEDIASTGACIGFPDDFDAWGIDNNICFVGIDATDVDPLGDVYKIKLGRSSATDLDIRGIITTMQLTETNIYSIDVCGDAEAASILVGTDQGVYRSTDDGGDWSGADKSPTGEMAQVLMSPDFLTSDIAYAATSGTDTSAFSRTSDGGNSWNQISLIDYGHLTDGYTVESLAAAGYNADGTLRMVTHASQGSAVFERTGGHWERIYFADNDVSQVIVNGKDTLFAVDKTAGKIYRSSDMGATWTKTITTKNNLSAVCAVSPTTLYTGHEDGGLYYSTRSGVGWTPANDTLGGVVVIISVKGDVVLASNLDGDVFISSDGGETVNMVGAGKGFLATFDYKFADNNIIYAAGADGVWKAEVDLDNPGDAEWSQEKAISASSPAVTLPPSGVLYVTDDTPVGDESNGGLWRSAGSFEQVTKGLADTDIVGLLDADVFPTVLFFMNSAADYNKQVLVYSDTLDCPVTLASPADGAAGVGNLYTGQNVVNAALVWEKMGDATSYQYQVALDADFNTVVDFGFTAGQLAPLALSPNATYYWKVRVAAEGPIGAPLFTPWSDTFKFKTAIGATAARPALQAPGAGATDVALSPTFEWSGIGWADKYEFQLATDPATYADGYFTEPLVALVGNNSLVSTAWKCDIALDYEGRYYWHVRAIGVDTSTPWSDVGTFTTMAKAAPPVTPGPAVVVPPADVITPAWIWAIVIIGAILVISVIVLIVTTRRVP